MHKISLIKTLHSHSIVSDCVQQLLINTKTGEDSTVLFKIKSNQSNHLHSAYGQSLWRKNSHCLSKGILLCPWFSRYVLVWVLLVCKLSSWCVHNKLLLTNASGIHWFYRGYFWTFHIHSIVPEVGSQEDKPHNSEVSEKSRSCYPQSPLYSELSLRPWTMGVKFQLHLSCALFTFCILQLFYAHYFLFLVACSVLFLC